MNDIALKTQCVGRVLIDLPIGGQASWVQRNPIDFRTAYAKSKEELWSQATQFIGEKRNKKHDTEGSLLSEVTEPTANSQFVFYREHPLDTIGHQLRGYVWVDTVGFIIDSFMLESQTFPDVTQNFVKLFDGIVSSNTNTVPQRPGFCIDRALINQTKDGRMVAGYHVSPKQWPKVSIGIGTSENQENLPKSAFEKLEQDKQRAKQINADLREFEGGTEVSIDEFSVLRERTRSVGGFEGEETVAKSIANNERVGYRFVWRHVGQVKSIEEPQIIISMKVGEYLTTDYDYKEPPPEQDLLALWDAVVESLRRRPGALPE